MRILLVEDDKKIADFTAKGLRQYGFAVDIAPDGKEASIMWGSVSYDIAVVDIMLPKLDGLSLVEKFRKRGVKTPVIFLSAKREVDDRIRGLQAGGDDYLCKPFSFSELHARINALLRRVNDITEPATSLIQIGELTMDLDTREVHREGKKIDIKPKEFQLLEYMMRNSGRIVTKTAILEHVYEYDFDPQTNVVDVLVCRLRNKIDKDFDFKMLQTVRGMGYVLKTR